MKRTGSLIAFGLVLVVAGAVVGHVLGRAGAGDTERITGIVGSEKGAFFADPAVRDVLARHGYTVRADPSGSREMAGRLAGYDFAFPSSGPAADELARQRQPAADPVVAFGSPLAIATFTPVVDVLQSAGLARRDAGGAWVLDLKALVEANRVGLRWNQIPGNQTHNVAQIVLVATTRPADSNSAAMFAVILNQVTGGDLAAVAKLFADQGAVDSTSEEPFESYLRSGKNFAPLVLIYEAQFVDHAFNTGLSNGQTLTYPAPTLICEHTVVPFTPAGVAVAKLLATDRDLQRLAAKHGFRTADATLSRPVLAQVRPGDAPLPDSIADAFPTPDATTLHTLLTKLEEKIA